MPADADTFELLQAITRVLRAQRTQNPTEVPFPKLSALAVLAEHGVRDLEGLAQEEFVSGPAMVETVKPLILTGLIEKAVDEADRRRILLKATPDGRRQLGLERERLDGMIAALSKRDRTALARAAGILQAVAQRSRARD